MDKIDKTIKGSEGNKTGLKFFCPHLLHMCYKGQDFVINICNQTISNEQTGEIERLADLRDLNFIHFIKAVLFS